MDSKAQWSDLAHLLLHRDPQLGKIIEQVGPPVLELERNHFRALAQCLISQQLAPKAATAIIDRVGKLAPPFPSPADFSRLRPATLKKAGLSRQKRAYLRELSSRWADVKWRRGWGRLEDAALVARLVEVKGIGEWTAHMFLIFSLGRPDVLPVGDYGVRRGLQLLRGLKEIPKPKEIPDLVPHWKGAASVGAWYLWRALDRKLL